VYAVCPKCGHDNGDDATQVCPRCSLVFAKYLKTRYQVETPTRSSHRPGKIAWFTLGRKLIDWDGRAVDSVKFWGQAVAWLGFAIWGLWLVWLDMETNAIGQSFMHNINLIFHEAGHAIFGLFGTFLSILGGSLMQVLMPMIVTAAFLIKNRDPFGASIGLWWTGESLMDVAVYINDARDMTLTLLGGGTGQDRPGMHDWNNLLSMMGLLSADRSIAWCVDVSGELLVLLAIVWGARVLRQQQRVLGP
jgi:hypothetical protein